MPNPRRPKLGQHFLTDPRYRRRIVQALDIRPHDLVIEIGPGHGAMTELLAERAQQVAAIELDADLARNLKEKLQGRPRIEIIRADILSTDLAAICRRHRAEKCFVFGNLPYYITSPILHHLFTFWTWIRAMGLLVQREVAERITAAPGSRAYGYLSVLSQFYSEPRVVLGVPPGAFSPAPKVHSALVEFRMKSPDKIEEGFPTAPGQAGLTEILHAQDEGKFLDFVKRCFAQKRKNLLNNLAAAYSRQRVEQELARLALPSSIRAEQMTLEQLAALFRRLG